MENVNKNRDFSISHYGDEKMNKSKELNNTMSIDTKPMDEYTKKIMNIGGKNND